MTNLCTHEGTFRKQQDWFLFEKYVQLDTLQCAMPWGDWTFECVVAKQTHVSVSEHGYIGLWRALCVELS